MKQSRARERQRAVTAEYERLASTYDRRWSAYIEASLEATLHRLPPLRPDRVLDVGCGSGALLARLADAFPEAALYGVDPSRAMLAVARARLDPEIALAAALAEALPFSPQRFDLVVSTSALHFFGDAGAALAEMHRVTRPGGLVLVTDWCEDFLTVKLFDRAMRMLGKANFTTLGAEACARLFREAGLEGVELERYRIGPLWGLMSVRGRRAQANETAAPASEVG